MERSKTADAVSDCARDTGCANPDRPPDGDWNWLKRQMPVTDRWAYFDHAAVAPLSALARDALAHWAAAAAEQGDTVWPEWDARVEQVRGRAAQLIGADAGEIALVGNTTQGIGIVAAGLPWQPGDNVVTLANEFPTNLYPWLNLAAQGVATRRVEVGPQGQVDLTQLCNACDARTRLISVSWVSYLTGWRLDLDAVAAVAHDANALLLVDAIQGLGVFPVDVRRTPIDFLAADGHKWLLGPEGAGLLFVRQCHLESLRPTGVGWHSVRASHEFRHDRFELRSDAARFEGGSANMPGLHALGASLELLQRAGLTPEQSPVATRVLKLTNHLVDQLRSLDAEVLRATDARHQSGIVSFRWPERDPKMIRRRCLEAGIVLSVRGGWLRASPHAYNDELEIERLVTELRS